MADLTRRDMLQSTACAVLSTSLAAGAATAGKAETAAKNQRVVVDGLDNSALDDNFLKLMDEGGIDCVHTSIGDISSFARVHGIAQANKRFAVAKTVADILQAKQDGKKSIIMGVQSAGNFEVALYSVSKNREFGLFTFMEESIRDFKGIGMGVMGICYNVTNVFGSGCIDHEGPLTRAGQRLVEMVHKNQIVLDVGGHTGERTSLDAIKLSSGVPVVCTHTNFAALNPNKRCVSDRTAEAIAATGGVIGIAAVSAFITHNASRSYMKDVQATMDQYLDQLDYGKRLVGVEHLGIGPDFVRAEGLKREHDPDNSLMFPADMMPSGLRSFVKGFEDIGKLPSVVAGLKSRGWTESELDAVLGGNWLRVFKQVWGA